MQLLGPPENVALHQIISTFGTAVEVEIRYEQVTVDPKGRIRLLVDLEPSFRSEFISVLSPYVLVPANGKTKRGIRIERTNVHVVPDRRDERHRACRNEQLVVDLSRNADNGL